MFSEHAHASPTLRHGTPWVTQESSEGYGTLKPARTQSSGNAFSARAAVLSIGLFMLGLLMMLPLWNAVRSLRDPVYVHFLGTGYSWAIITACVGIVAAYVLVVPSFLDFSNANEAGLSLVANCFIVLLGTLLLIISCPLSLDANTVSLGLFQSCGSASHELFLVSQGLQVLRAQADCDGMLTVESCAGFERSPSSEFLKQMENGLRCSGFCHSAAGALLESNATLAASDAPANATLISSAAALLAATVPTRTVAHGEGDAAAVLLQTGVTVSGASAASTSEEDLAVDVLDTTKSQIKSDLYPPTLFSNANFQASCEGMAARHLKYTAGDISSGLFWEGILLIFSAIVVATLKLCSMIGNKDGTSW